MTDSVRIIPAILTDDPGKLRVMLQQAAKFTNYIQIDIMDGQFVPSRSISFEQIVGIPQKISWEAHLMVKQPEKQLENFQKAGARKVNFHYEATPAPNQVISLARKLGLEVGLAVNPGTTIPEIMPYVDEVDGVLFLSVHPGYYGARFIPEVLEKIAVLRQMRPSLKIGIDGGIKKNNILEIAKIGVDEICIGSAIFSQPQPGESYRRLLELVQKKIGGNSGNIL
jgi:ribulose-phosphate 3-epimerase